MVSTNQLIAAILRADKTLLLFVGRQGWDSASAHSLETQNRVTTKARVTF